MVRHDYRRLWSFLKRRSKKNSNIIASHFHKERLACEVANERGSKYGHPQRTMMITNWPPSMTSRARRLRLNETFNRHFWINNILKLLQLGEAVFFPFQLPKFFFGEAKYAGFRERKSKILLAIAKTTVFTDGNRQICKFLASAILYYL